MLNKKNDNKLLIEEVSKLYPTEVKGVFVPKTIEELQCFLKDNNEDISIGGARFSMGGQIAHPETIHVDMRHLNKIKNLNIEDKTIIVEAGICWIDIIKEIDKSNLSIKVMQTYSNFTVSGALSVNAHGRYVGYGSIISTVMEITLLNHKGERIKANRKENSDIFYGAIGGYGGLGIIVEVKLSLTDNCNISNHTEIMDISLYQNYFKNLISENEIIFQNADIQLSDFSKVKVNYWKKTTEETTIKDKFKNYEKSFFLEKYFLWSITELPAGNLRREKIIEPLYRNNKKIICSRNYEASYDVKELEPFTRKYRTYVLQEYFIPTRNFLQFNELLKEIVKNNKVNLLNVSIRHAPKDEGSILAWAQEEVFAFVLYYKQKLDIKEKEHVEKWTKDIIEAALSCEGTYYLPYQPHATKEQFMKAYPNYQRFFELKKEKDPNYRFKNVLWAKYYK